MNDKPAFPQPDMVDDGQLISQGDTGMALRDYFAAKLVTWFLTELSNENMQVDPDEPPAMPPDLLRQFAADHAYKMADAMMKARGV
jgi:hypothetical protein